MRVTFQLAKCLASAGHEITLLGRRPPDNIGLYYSLPHGVRPHFWQTETHQPDHSSGSAFDSEFHQILASIPESGLLIASNSLDALAVANLGTPRIYFVQGVEPDFYKSNPHKQEMAERSYRQDAHFIAVSESVRRELNNRYNVECSGVIPPAVEDTFLTAGNNRKLSKGKPRKGAVRVLYAGPAESDKGYNDLLSALKLLQEVGFAIWLDVANQGQNDPRLLGQVYGSFHKPVGDAEMANLYMEADLLVYPSHREAFGLVPLEAMACGTPTVVSDSGGIRQYARDGFNTLIVTPSSPRDLAHAIRTLTADALLSERIVINGLETAKLFSLEAMCRSWGKEMNKFTV